MIEIEPLTPLNALTFKTLRLRALRDDPQAFGSTYAKESQLGDADWIKRATQWSDGERSIMFLASDEGVACGIAGSFLDEGDITRAQLVSMWMAPTHRRRGLGRLLVKEVLGWARSRNVRVLHLMVTSNNDDATSFYERLGFRRTGRIEPYPNDSSLVEYEMSRPVD
jgi:ribosomal protein S18 acetylase RimI-like enzyme